MVNHDSLVPGFAIRPNDRVRVNVPAGVRVDPSDAAPTPAAPTKPPTDARELTHPDGVRVQPETFAVVDVDVAATTLSTWVAVPV